MNPSLRRAIYSIPGMNTPYRWARGLYRRRRILAGARNYFVNPGDFAKAYLEEHEGELTLLQTRDGLHLTVRNNCMDAVILSEVFIDREYVQGLDIGSKPTVVDIGGYIGDFSIFAAKYLDASRVIVVEPSPKNLKLLLKNVQDNALSERITAVEGAVTDGNPIFLDVDAPERAQARVSAYGASKAPLQRIRGISLEQLVEDFGLEKIDLLKIDCEGGEYQILLTAPREILQRIENIVFEFHEVQGFAEQLEAVKKRLGSEGFSWRSKGHLVFASRRR